MTTEEGKYTLIEILSYLHLCCTQKYQFVDYNYLKKFVKGNQYKDVTINTYPSPIGANSKREGLHS